MVLSMKDWRGNVLASKHHPVFYGAAGLLVKLFLNWNGKLTGISMRVPTLDVSVVDLTVNLKNPASKGYLQSNEDF